MADCPVAVVQPGLLRDFGGRAAFAGQAATVRCYESNVRVRQLLESPGGGRVLVVDGGGSLRCALLGDNLAAAAARNGWAGARARCSVGEAGEPAAAAWSLARYSSLAGAPSRR